jgi:glycosyltransferase involved in cell wall biosynthesis
MRTSCATQIYDLGQAFIDGGHCVTVVIPKSHQKQALSVSFVNQVRLIRVKAFRTKDINYIQRTLAEFINPFIMWRHIYGHKDFLEEYFDGIIWYSPTIFWGPLIKRLKKQFNAKAYLVLRDIFPDWALHLGLIKKGIIFHFLKAVEQYQYRQANVIGVQSPNNLIYFKKHNPKLIAQAEVLWNWIGPAQESKCQIDLNETKLAGKKVMVYTGNMGVAQAMGTLVNLAELMSSRQDVGFIFVGRGSEVDNLKRSVQQKKLENILFFDEIDPSHIPGLYQQCAIGLVTLDPRHQTHNIPGKFLSYMQAALPVVAIGNPGNDLQILINSYQVGIFGPELSQKFLDQLGQLIDGLEENNKLAQKKCFTKILNDLFLPRATMNQIIRSF